ncbi:helix-turn-helix domain-containing protein [uncultured Microbacterium sp.]|uniref:helix-turn-helix domain-containing protein n=1 Tax=uncultured Microbacterium sp. TaxID=191216 RepID=UPI0025E02EAF|nr:helix-turn-helix domain-containing protein [uncultured Microbacterium sp.]
MSLTNPAAIAAPIQPEPLRLLTVEAAAEATGLSVRSIRHLIATRRVPVVRLGRAIRLREVDLAAWIADNTQPATDASTTGAKR